jgi:hypothetical protein
MLDDGPLSVADLAQGSGASPQPLGRVIRTLGMLGLFRTTEDGRVETTPLGATLSRDHPQTQANVAEMWMEQQYLPFSDLLHTVRTGEPATEHYLGQPPFDWISADPERAALFARAMADVTGTMRTGLFDGYDLPSGKVVADIGGADGRDDLDRGADPADPPGHTRPDRRLDPRPLEHRRPPPRPGRHLRRRRLTGQDPQRAPRRMTETDTTHYAGALSWLPPATTA